MSDANPSAAFLDLEFPVEVWLTTEKVPLERLLRLQPGGILKLDKDPDQPVDLVVNGAVVATGELVVVDSKFAFRVLGTAQRNLAALEAGGNGDGDETAGPGGGAPPVDGTGADGS